ncbi:phosphate transport system regulatory protein PhoU [Longimonas halophila]|uniref:Phosphate-specific transport system accessory protein PhoU n=2 Tax=Longimonas halophila TaxID=1469170 RepID=A0A2H3NKD4_9BACT|nr:phosphate transport system regulatory protein PhoU [Longimonas halophila]
MCFPSLPALMSRQNLTRELAELRHLLLSMADIVKEQFGDAVHALLTDDLELAEAVVERDNEVDRLELEIDQQCERILALYQPVAVDLRFLIVVVKINTDLERMGDHCRNLARNVEHVRSAPSVIEHTKLKELAEACSNILAEAQRSFLERDETLAQEVPTFDERVNALHRENFNQLVQFCKSHPEHAEPAAHLITASKAIERIGDHAKSIAKSVVFLIEGEDLRHASVQAQDASSESGS